MLAVNSEHGDAAPIIAEGSHRLRENPRKTQCQVEGCRIALPKRKAYHKRYRICSYHATLSQLVLEGRHMRFCQQCGRFQLLAEFEGDKRSCRAKLDLHNVRRKQAREAAIRRSPDDVSPPRKTHNAPYGTRMKSVTRVSNSSDEDNDDEEDYEEPCSSSGGSGPCVTSGAPLPPSFYVPAAVANGMAATNGLRHDHDIDELLRDFLSDENIDKHATDELLQEIINAPILPLDVEGAAARASDASLHHARQQQHISSHQEYMAPAFTAPVPAPPHPALLPQIQQQQQPAAAAVQEQQQQQQHTQIQQNYSSYQIAEELLSTHNETNPAVSYDAPYDLVRVSFKLFNVHPSELPECVANEVKRILRTSTYLMQNARIGCTHLSIEALLSHQERAALENRGSLGLLNAAISQGDAFFPSHTFEGPKGKLVAQLGSEVSLKTGNSDAVTVRLLSGSSTALCCVNRVVPMAVDSTKAARFKLYGSNISGSQDMIVCRQGPNVPDLEVLGLCPSSLQGEDVVEFVLPRPAEGLHIVEVQRGSLLSTTAVSFLVIDNAEAVKEIRQLEVDSAGVGDEQAVTTFLKNVGVVLDWNKMNASVDTDAGPSSSRLPSTPPSTTSNTSNADAQKRISEIAQRVAATCIVRGWPALLRLVLPAMVPPGTDPGTVIEGFKSFSKQGLSMLHLAAMSRCAEVVTVLAAWASEIGYTWHCEAASTAAGLTPLHLASLIADKGVMASVLTSMYPEGVKLWTTARATSDQARPIDFAMYANNIHVLQWLKKQGVVADVANAVGAGAIAAASAGNKGDDGASGSPTRLNKDDANPLQSDEDTVDLETRQLLGRLKKRGMVGRAEFEELRSERKTSYLDAVCEEMTRVEEELKRLPNATIGGGCGGDGSSVSWQLLRKGALVIFTAGAAALATYLKTIQT